MLCLSTGWEEKRCRSRIVECILCNQLSHMEEQIQAECGEYKAMYLTTTEQLQGFPRGRSPILQFLKQGHHYCFSLPTVRPTVRL
jgi:hypothetical protein